MVRTKITIGKWLYRYDLSQPLAVWSSGYKNPEYEFSSGNKNQFGGFFFFDSEQQAENTGRKALKRYKNRSFDGLWITKCQTTSDSEFLDLRGYVTITAILSDFYRNGIDVFNDEFHEFYFGEKKPFAGLKEPIGRFCKIMEDPFWYKDKDEKAQVDSIIRLVETFFIDNGHPGFFGQCITDFSNGIAFKRILEEHHYDGYIFNEANGMPGTNTLCFQSSDKLSRPEIRVVNP